MFRLDRGVTSLADAWLDQLSNVAKLEQVSVVIPSSTEFAGMLTQVIRLRLPSAWMRASFRSSRLT